MNNKVIIPLLLILVVAMLGASVSGFFLKRNTLSMSENAALLLKTSRVERVEGTVEVLQGDSARTVEETQEMKEGDSVKVGSGGSAVIYWQDGSLSRIKGPAEVTVTKMNVNENLDTNVDMTLKTGEVWTKVLDMVTDDSSFTTRTKTTVASIRGTEVFQKSSDGEEIVSTYEHGVDLEINGEKKALLEGEEFRLEYGKETMQTRASDPAGWISDAKKKDKEYIASLSAGRMTDMQRIMERLPSAFPSNEELNTLLDFSTGDLKEKNSKVQDIIDTLSLQIKIAYGRGDLDGVKKKAEQLGLLLDTYIPALETSDQRDSLVNEAVKRMNVQQKILFGDQTVDELISLRAKLGLAKLTLVADNSDKSAAFMQRQLFFVQDLLRKGKTDDAKQYLAKLAQFDRVNEPAWNDMSDIRRKMLQKTTEQLLSQLPDMKTTTEAFQKRVLSREMMTHTNGALSTTEQIRLLMSQGKITEAEKLFATLTKTEKVTVSEEFPVLGGVTPAEKNLNSNSSAGSREEKKAAVPTSTSTTITTRKPTTTSSSHTTTATSAPAPTSTSTSTTTNKETTTRTAPASATTTTTEKPALITAPTRTVNKNANTATTTTAPAPMKGVYTPAK